MKVRTVALVFEAKSISVFSGKISVQKFRNRRQVFDKRSSLSFQGLLNKLSEDNSICPFPLVDIFPGHVLLVKL